MKTLTIALLCFIAGCIARGLFVRKGLDLVGEEQLVNFQHAELLKGTLVASGQDQKVITLIRNYIEDGIARDSSIQTLYTEEKHRKRIKEEILRFYFALEEEPPSHVQKWLEDGSLTYEKIEDALSVFNLTVGQNKSEFYCTQKYKNVSNEQWIDLVATAYLYDSENNLIDKKRVRLEGGISPLEEAAFSFTFEKKNSDQESSFEEFDIDVTIEGRKAEPVEIANT